MCFVNQMHKQDGNTIELSREKINFNFCEKEYTMKVLVTFVCFSSMLFSLVVYVVVINTFVIIKQVYFSSILSVLFYSVDHC